MHVRIEIFVLLAFSLDSTVSLTCSGSPPKVDYAILSSLYTGANSITEYVCPPHWVFDSTLTRTGEGSTCDGTTGTYTPVSAVCIRNKVLSSLKITLNIFILQLQPAIQNVKTEELAGADL